MRLKNLKLLLELGNRIGDDLALHQIDPAFFLVPPLQRWNEGRIDWKWINIMNFGKSILILVVVSFMFIGCGVKGAPVAPEDVKKESKEKITAFTRRKYVYS